MPKNSFESSQALSGTGVRNTAKLIDIADSHFDAAHLQGVMALYADPREGRQVQLRGRNETIVDFVRCSYLGLDNHPRIVAGAIEAVRQNGSLHWSCARTRLSFAQLVEFEEVLSKLFEARSITYTTVLAANMSALPLVASGHLTGGIKPTMVFDRFAHATLAYHKKTVADETAVQTVPHNDYEMLEDICKKNRSVAYICDGVYSMGGSAHIDELKRLQEKYGLFLYIDDAHGVSIVGRKGQGYARSQFDNLGDRTIIVTSLGKGFGASGGLLMLGTAHQESLFRRYAIAHAFSASLNTAAIGAGLASAEIHQSSELRQRQAALQDNIALFDRLIPTAQSGSTLPIRIIRVGDEMTSIGCAQELLKNHFYASAIFFPTVARGKAGLRVSITASHQANEIESFCSAVKELLIDNG
ncbi:8-amino-7-oxononanoate synthase family protein [Ochrobactrum soli]|uniref:Aminotransferase class I/II-fold pyridoxal phosphate-dependent enzyme n=1 Tax=Ochrobactrum soli TaxID=2448455 RepID=A0A849KV04_9HYPH|nr:aminotransferase class I/II-fold pyridoxal phosphate-dependent enzyme [[Ochrobactrum] soli]NNU60866.1 aminotransferase class I/II-fold pyridoxal phosphate-dependent enzyme [[Ochrobactrum] soli]